MTTNLTMPQIDIDLIDVEDEFNAREKFDPEELKALAQTIEDTGFVQGIKVVEKPGGRYKLVAGERRYRAAKMTPLKKIDASLATGDPQLESLIENLHRANLNPIEAANGVKAFAEAKNLQTNIEIAKKLRKNPEWVGARLVLLKLPKSVQRYIAAGHVPMDAEPLLRPVAEVSPRIAAFLCEIAKMRELSGRQFIDTFGQLFEEAPRVEGIKKMPTMIGVPRFYLADVIPEFDPEKNKEHAELVRRAIDAFYSYGLVRPEDAQVTLGEPEIDAARAAGVLVEHHEGSHTRAFIIDSDLAVDLVDRAIERRAKEREEEAKLAEARKEEQRKEKKEARRQASEQRKANGELSPQAQAKADSEYAVRFNELLGGELLERRDGGKSKKHDLSRGKAVAKLIVLQNPRLAGRGLRFTLGKLRDVERTPLKKGGSKEKITYATDEECTAELLRRIDATRSGAEAIEVVTEAILAALLADNKAEPASRRPHWDFRLEKSMTKLLKAEVKEVRPRKPRRVKQKAA